MEQSNIAKNTRDETHEETRCGGSDDDGAGASH